MDSIAFSTVGAAVKKSPFSPHVVDNWPTQSRRMARQLMAWYGLPSEVSESMAIWYGNGPWKRTVVHRNGVDHNFPVAHADILEQTVSYRVPMGALENLMKFDGSIVVDRTRGELTAWCHNEAMNMILLNLAHDIVQGEKTPEEARKAAAGMVFRLRFGWPTPYAEKLMFGRAQRRDVEGNDAQDPDRRMPMVGARA